MLNRLVDSGSGTPDAQETTFSLDAVARFVCNTLDEVREAQRRGGWQIDVVIVGSGMYGAYAASKLHRFSRGLPTEARPRVLVLESGPFLVSEHFQNLTRLGPFFALVNRPIVGDDQSFLTQIDRTGGDLQGMSPHHRCVGGKSIFWGGWAPRLTEEDFARVGADGRRLWPQEVVDYLLHPGAPNPEQPGEQRFEDGYGYVERQIGVVPVADYVRGQLTDELKLRLEAVVAAGTVASLTAVRDAPIAVQAEAPASGLFSMDKYSSLPLLLDSLREDSDASGGDDANRFLFLIPNVEVLRLETQRGQVTEIVAALRRPSRDIQRPDPVSTVERLALKEGAMVLLAGNAVNSTRLALNSLPRPAEFGPERIGRNLMAHVRGNFFWRVRRSALGLPAGLRDFSSAALHVEGRAPLRDGRFGRFHFQLYALGSLGDNPEEYLYRLIPHLDDLDAARDAVTSTDTDEWVVLGVRTCGEMFGDPDADVGQRSSSFISVNPFGGSGDDAHPAPGGEVRVPKAFVCLIQSADDAVVRQAQTEAAFALVEALTAGGGEAPQLIRGGEDPIGSTHHESGTLWLGDDPATSVTDLHGRFHHVANAGCIDQAIFPTVGSANPVPTGLALAQMTVRHLVLRATSTPDAGVEPGFRAIFDGTSLGGWTKLGGGQIHLLEGIGLIEAGTRGVDSDLGLLRYDSEEFADFILRLDWKAFSIHANSGVFLRMPGPPEGDLDTLHRESIEVQIDESGKDFAAGRSPQAVYGSSLHKTGAVYGMAPASRWAAKAPSPHGVEGYWNRFEIRVEGRGVSVALNGEPVSAARLPDGSPARGHIALQCHTEIVQFRNIRVREL